MNIDSTNDKETINACLNAIILDIQKQIEYFDVNYIPTIYIGGGSPSILSLKQIASFLYDLLKILPSRPIEWTIEINPESATKDFLEICKNYGVNRISAGIQTFSKQSRDAVHRNGTIENIYKNIECISKIYGRNFSLDVITGLPFSTKEQIKSDLKIILDFEPEHISLYDLTIEEDTTLFFNILKNKSLLPKKEYAEMLWILGRDILISKGYFQYEVSNFAFDKNNVYNKLKNLNYSSLIKDKKAQKNGFCLHNMRYWFMENWLGAGPSAGGAALFSRTNTSTENNNYGMIYNCVDNVFSYIKHVTNNTFPQYCVTENISKKNLIKETIFMGFRTSFGPDAELFQKRFSCSLQDIIPNTINKWREKKLFYTEKTALTPQGLLFLNGFIRNAFEEIANLE
jgi:oxygen-independent coproporphyrinogen-3 oxidase